MTPRIRVLSPLLASQIAAGEVIERPASVVKELVENSIDAQAARIEVDLEGGGIELIRIVDDGVGIAHDDLPLALAAHATSKISQIPDLDRITTMGFRGEALASIASVSRVRIVSKPRDQSEAWSITAEGDLLTSPSPASGPPGTCIEVRNLFFNTPARRKFLRTTTTELSRCLEWLTSLALAHPAIGFTVRADGRLRLEAPPLQEPAERVHALLGSELRDQLIEVRLDTQDDDRGLAIWGLVGRPAVARATAASQHVFLNGRLIRDRTIQHALREAYRGLIEPGRFPTAVLMLDMSPSAVDVNVHPAKLEVRFRDQSMVHQAVLHCVRDALREADLTAAATTLSKPAHARSDTALPGDGFTLRSTNAFIEHLRAAPTPAPSAIRAALEPTPVLPPEQVPPHVLPHEALLPQIRPADRALQIHNTYIVTQDEAGLVIIDQHALHERVMYERFWQRLTTGPLESQRLLTPITHTAPPTHIDAIETLGPLLHRCGIELQRLAPNAVGIGAFPSLLFQRGVDPLDFLQDLLERAARSPLPPTEEEALHEVIDMMACKAAVKAGDRLGDEDLRELLALRTQVERSAACPHGRPTSVRVTIEQLEKLFHRR